MIAWLAGISPDTVSLAIKTIRPPLREPQIPAEPAPVRLRTAAATSSITRAHAGITLPPEIKPAC